jgi:hypothetical membrane protein
MNTNSISTSKAFRFTGSLSLVLGILTVFAASLAYASIQPGFSIFNTYLSEIGDTPGWPQILFNTGTLLAAPLRYAVLILVVLRMRSISQKRGAFETVLLSIGAFSTLGTILMTAVPFSVAPAIHKSGIGLYFLGVVFLQTLLGVRQLSMKSLPRVLPALSFSIVASFLVFFVLFILYETGNVRHTTPIFWEWMCFFTSMVWLLGHSIVLGKEEPGRKTT